jgi:hypothetical protein
MSPEFSFSYNLDVKRLNPCHRRIGRKWKKRKKMEEKEKIGKKNILRN